MSCVGLFVGPFVGVAVGLAVGATVGFVGAFVGAAVGFFVGVGDGADVANKWVGTSNNATCAQPGECESRLTPDSFCSCNPLT